MLNVLIDLEDSHLSSFVRKCILIYLEDFAPCILCGDSYIALYYFISTFKAKRLGCMIDKMLL